jgi:hypothetical protein
MKANTLTQITLIAGIATAATAIYVGVSVDPEPQIIKEIIYVPAPTTSSTSTTTTSTTTTTTTTLPPKPAAPAKSQLVRKVDELYPGASQQFGAATIEKAGKFACKRWNETQITRLNVIRDVMEYTNIDDLQFGHAIAEAVVWTICWETTSFPNGPREYR